MKHVKKKPIRETMQSCDNVLLSQLLSNFSYKEIVLSSGVANNLRSINYAGEQVYIADGRGYLDYCILLNRLSVPYIEIPISELFRNDFNDENIMIFIPKVFLQNTDKLQSMEKNSHIAFIYSAYQLKKRNGYFELSLSTDFFDESFHLYGSDLDTISNLNVKPLQYALKIIRIIDPLYKITERQMLTSIQLSLENCLESRTAQSENTQCISGIDFYDNFLELLKHYHTLPNSSPVRVKKHTLYSSINSGGACFYRKEFIDYLHTSPLFSKVDDSILSSLEQVAEAWLELAKLLRLEQRESYDASYVSKITKLVNMIKEHEQCSFIGLSHSVQNI